MPPKKKAVASSISPLVPPLRALLHTMRCVSQHEDALCTLLHNLKDSPDSEELRTELAALLDQLPARDYIDDLHALHNALATSQPAKTAP